MDENPTLGQSWVSEGSMDKLLKTFSEFLSWLTSISKHSPNIGLWQLGNCVTWCASLKLDLAWYRPDSIYDPLETWSQGRVIIIGDAAHPMLPTQGQGANQGIEDAEALGAFFKDVQEAPSRGQLNDIFGVNYSSPIPITLAK
ncbi:FAD/NAD(P)-binding domain-containing protein [Penicillium angulare]|uniref:FAD/NAD(P)-binding domain-containing protein n=1 Tax=Penicillium angulare TaxID=116970 RepID=UPI00254071F6|nr:FAD/NAD(P)-binding domain-containing protein [Penicillium angulare]KAJ5281517.1 FAD/NAD(P)-binding domain-containing protein [Penicillium angulare]